MAVTEKTGVWTHVDDNGNKTLLYPAVKTDTTLTVSGSPADSAAVGEAIPNTKTKVANVLGYCPPSYLVFENVAIDASLWATYEATLPEETDIVGTYPYKADIPLAGVTADHSVKVNFSAAEISDKVFAPYVNSAEGYARIYAKSQPIEEITIPNITAIKKEV